jgi:hypothetical protein
VTNGEDQGAEPTGWELMRALTSFKDDIKADIGGVKTDVALLGGRVVSIDVYSADQRGNTLRHERAETRIRDIENGQVEAEKLRRSTRIAMAIAVLAPILSIVGAVLVKAAHL